MCTKYEVCMFNPVAGRGVYNVHANTDTNDDDAGR